MAQKVRFSWAAMVSLLLVGVTWLGVSGSASASDWTRGDLFIGVGGGSYQVRDANGLLKEAITGPFGGFTTGCAFNNEFTRFYGTYFDATKVVAFDFGHPHGVAQVVDTALTSPGGHSESILFKTDGHFYVGHPDGNDLIHEYDGGGTLVTTFAAAIDVRGTDWMDLTIDQNTLFYTSEGRRVLRFDVANNAQLADFTILPGGGTAFAVRLLPPGDGSGGLLVADTSNIKRLDAAGNVVQTYAAAGEDSWFALTLDPNGTSFWSANTATDNVYRFNIQSGAQEVSFSTGTGALSVFGLCQMEDRPPVALCQDVTVPTDPGLCTTANASVDDGSFDPDTPLFGDTITLDQQPPGPYSLGDTGVTLTVTDNIGKSGVCSATVAVVDLELPAIACSPNQVIECTSPGGASATVGAKATDNCSLAGSPICVPPSGTFPIGSTTVTCSVSDGSGNANQCNSIVAVVDTTAPTLSCVPSVNPSGSHIPAASNTNEDGFYRVVAGDVCSTSLSLTLGGVTLLNGETIKITQTPGRSGVRFVGTMGPAAIKHFLVGPGDAVITSTDGSGNVGSVTCLVPPPPK